MTTTLQQRTSAQFSEKIYTKEELHHFGIEECNGESVWLKLPKLFTLNELMQYLDAGLFQQSIEKFQAMVTMLDFSIVETHRKGLSDKLVVDKQMMLPTLMPFREECKKMEFRNSMFYSAMLIEHVNDENRDLYEYQLSEHIKGILKGLFIDQTTQLFLRVPHELEDYYYRFAKDIIGVKVVTTFPLMEYDLAHAGKCYAVEEYTACVFHLMRVMELAVKEFGNRLGVDLSKYQMWNDILSQCNAKLNEKFKTKEEKQSPENISYRSIVTHLDNVKQAWRNEVMHPAAKYEKWQADGVISTVKSFLTEFVNSAII